jgi:hypothetical protein
MDSASQGTLGLRKPTSQNFCEGCAAEAPKISLPENGTHHLSLRTSINDEAKATVPGPLLHQKAKSRLQHAR